VTQTASGLEKPAPQIPKSARPGVMVETGKLDGELNKSQKQLTE